VCSSDLRLEGDFLDLYNIFFEEYLAATGDEEMMRVVAPFFTFRGLVVASPEWYPGHPPKVRAALLRFLRNVLEDEVFDWRDPNRYLE